MRLSSTYALTTWVFCRISENKSHHSCQFDQPCNAFLSQCSFLNDRLDLNTGGHPLYFNLMHQCIKFRPSLAVQWLRLWASTAGARVRSLVGELRFCGEAKKKNKKLQKTKCVRLSLLFFVRVFQLLWTPAPCAGHQTALHQQTRPGD